MSEAVIRDHPNRRREDDHWALDKRVNIAVIIALIGNALVGGATLIWVTRGLTDRLDNHEKEIVELKTHQASYKQVESAVIEVKAQIPYITQEIRALRDDLKSKR